MGRHHAHGGHKSVRRYIPPEKAVRSTGSPVFCVT